MLSVVMPIWFPSVDAESMEVTQAAIDSLGKVELILIDNGSAYGSGWINQRATTFLRFSHNRGYTVAVNRGIDLCTNEVIALVNNDIRVSPGWQEQAIEILKDSEIATLHPKMVDYNSPFATGDVLMKTGHERWCQNSFVVTTRHWLDQMREKESGTVYGYEQFPGHFDENYGIGGGADDWDFYFRVRNLGGKTCYTNRFAFQHLHSFSLQKLGPEREKIAKQNDDYFTSKWGIKKEDWLAKDFPDQVVQNYKEGFI